jgi:hypothetical protein
MHRTRGHSLLIIADLSNASFIALVLSPGSSYLGQQAGIAVFIDLLWVVLFSSQTTGNPCKGSSGVMCSAGFRDLLG